MLSQQISRRILHIAKFPLRAVLHLVCYNEDICASLYVEIQSVQISSLFSARIERRIVLSLSCECKVGPPRFELGFKRPKRLVIDQATLRPRGRFIKVLEKIDFFQSPKNQRFLLVLYKIAILQFI